MQRCKLKTLLTVTIPMIFCTVAGMKILKKINDRIKSVAIKQLLIESIIKRGKRDASV